MIKLRDILFLSCVTGLFHSTYRWWWLHTCDKSTRRYRGINWYSSRCHEGLVKIAWWVVFLWMSRNAPKGSVAWDRKTNGCGGDYVTNQVKSLQLSICINHFYFCFSDLSCLIGWYVFRLVGRSSAEGIPEPEPVWWVSCTSLVVNISNLRSYVRVCASWKV